MNLKVVEEEAAEVKGQADEDDESMRKNEDG